MRRTSRDPPLSCVCMIAPTCRLQSQALSTSTRLRSGTTKGGPSVCPFVGPLLAAQLGPRLAPRLHRLPAAFRLQQEGPRDPKVRRARPMEAIDGDLLRNQSDKPDRLLLPLYAWPEVWVQRRKWAEEIIAALGTSMRFRRGRRAATDPPASRVAIVTRS